MNKPLNDWISGLYTFVFKLGLGGFKYFASPQEEGIFMDPRNAIKFRNTETQLLPIISGQLRPCVLKYLWLKMAIVKFFHTIFRIGNPSKYEIKLADQTGGVVFHWTTYRISVQ